MKAFFLRHKKLHFWLLADLCLLAAFLVLRESRGAMAVLAAAMGALRRDVGRVCYLVPFSVMEVLCILLVLFAVGYGVWSIVAVVRAGGRRLARSYSALLGAVCLGLTVYVGFCYLWGVTYYVDSFQDRSGVYAQDVAKEDLEAVTWYFARQLTAAADTVERDENGLFAVSREEIFRQSVHVYDETEKQFPFLAFQDRPPKAVRFSRVMSRLDFTGVYCPFTGESNVNVDSPACLLPSTIAHELAHQRGIALEQECNFLAILSSTTCGDDAYAYSGWLLGYIYLGNALYGEDQALWQPVYQSLPETVRADLADNNAYWRQFQDSTVKKASNQVYDSFLKGYGAEQGLKSYGMVVDLLVAYYKDQI